MVADWKALAQQVSNWGRWGEHDQLGTLNFITPKKIAGAATLARTGKVFSLCIPLNGDGPQGGNGGRRNPIHLMTLDGGDADLADKIGGWGGEFEASMHGMYTLGGPMRFNDDYIMMPLQSSTQWDALAHVYYEDQLYNGYPANSVTSLGATRNAIDKIAQVGQILGRGVLLDVARAKGFDVLPPNTIITAQDLDDTARAQGVTIEEGDIVVVRTGWWSTFTGYPQGGEWIMGSPGISWRVAEWLSDHNVAAIASDNIAVEVMPPEEGLFLLFHMLAIRDMGMMLGEIWDLEALGADCAADGVYEFLLSAAPLEVSGGVGSPVNPLAIK
ncbi:cyclase family protein [soil metagenome]